MRSVLILLLGISGAGVAVALLAQQGSRGIADPDGGTGVHVGLIEPHRVIHLSPAVDGVLEVVLVKRGDLVRKGQVVAELESSVEQAALAIAETRTRLAGEKQARKASLEFNLLKQEQDESLRHKGIISQFEADQSKTEKRIAEAGLLQVEESLELAELERERARAVLDLRTIRSPVSGVVVERNLDGGELATRQSQSVIVEIAAIDPLHVELILPVQLFGTIQVGQGADVFPQEPISGRYRATVTVVDRVVDAESGTFRVRLELPNPENELPAGIQCTVRFD